MTIKLLVTGDSHLNYYSQRLGGRLAERRQRIGEAWARTIDYALEHHVDVYLHLGDLFDQISPRNPPRAAVVEGFRRLKEAGIESFIIAGNHEAPGSMAEGASPHAVLHEAKLATVFEGMTSFGHRVLDVKGEKVSIAGMSFNQRLPAGSDPLGGLDVPSIPDGLNVAMLHYSVEGITAPLWEEPVIKLASLQRNPNIQLYAVGHIHRHSEKRVGNSLVLAPGATERFDFGEATHETGFTIVEVEGLGLRTRFVPTEAQPMERLALQMNMFPKTDRNKRILEAVRKAGNRDKLLQVTLEGELPFEEYTTLDFVGLFDEGARGNFYFEYVDSVKVRVPGMELRESEGLHPRRELAELARREIEKAPHDQRRVWERAVALALEAYDAAEES